jgi:hypothetical protein
VAHQFAGKVKFMQGPKLAPGVDVVVGDDFRAVRGHARTELVLKHAVRTRCPKAAG